MNNGSSKQDIVKIKPPTDEDGWNFFLVDNPEETVLLATHANHCAMVMYGVDGEWEKPYPLPEEWLK